MFGDFCIFSIVGVSRLNWTGHVCRMDSNRRISPIFNNNPQERRLRGRPKNRWQSCAQTDNNKMQNYKIGKRGQRTELTGKSTLRRKRSELDCSGI
jgi:hypothetical protein